MLRGVDVSHWDGDIDWAEAKDAGLAFASIKLSQGCNIIDSMAAHNVAGCRAVGLPIIPYHYYYPGQTAESQWDKFHDAIEVCGGWDGMLCAALDVEGDASNKLRGVTPGSYIGGALGWLRCLEKEIGQHGWVYTYPSFASTHHVGITLGAYPLWAASYSGKKPAPFSGWGGWSIWQYTDQGEWPGIGTGVDLNYFDGTLEELMLRSATASKAIKVVGPNGTIKCDPQWSGEQITVATTPLLEALGLPIHNPAVHEDTGRAYVRELEQFTAPWKFFYRTPKQGPRVYVKKVLS